MAFSEQLLMDRVNVVDAGEARREKRAQRCGPWHGYAAHVRYRLACDVTVRDRSQHGACASRRVRRSHRQACGAPCLRRDAKFADGPYGRGGRSPQANRRSTFMCCTKCSHWRRLIRHGRLAWQRSKRQRLREAFPN
jgi:hypothetical protein